jgi:hypothetical protein
MFKILMAVIVLIVAVMIAGAHFDINPVLAIFLILGWGVYKVGQIGGPQLPEGARIWGNTYGIHLSGRDFAPPDTDSHSGGNFRDGVDPNELAKRR